MPGPNPKPARDYPNQNSIHGVALHIDARTFDVAGALAPVAYPSPLKLNTPVAIGTIPGRSFVIGVDWAVAVAATGAATIDFGTLAAGTKWLNAVALNAVAKGAAAVGTLGYVGDGDTVIYATLKANADLSNLVAKIVLSYYAKGD